MGLACFISTLVADFCRQARNICAGVLTAANKLNNVLLYWTALLFANCKLRTNKGTFPSRISMLFFSANSQSLRSMDTLCSHVVFVHALKAILLASVSNATTIGS
ncbi:hypothetical protein, unlikely [Trypanosoma brucei gambiense DAL972]|uniref:T. brucei spp.-specific protein n=1 Tax=Trypanosoma brucei gambiense (strain MHOM/CI/86/DAL972) TaxID=679716 RepID=D0A904_TRYB9|nr:hypothetical protein, unlikely [Trypanosoma brucei gambiense DAL972]CBH18155.1 hypothetical protein, unlikely [Trypanosoma brucei gambiense DAL972]|eukprot:XP_011780419.1 hypothetical protein, unlikely [Trypanosoma brucei gambiense DAL972]